MFDAAQSPKKPYVQVCTALVKEEGRACSIVSYRGPLEAVDRGLSSSSLYASLQQHSRNEIGDRARTESMILD